MDLAPLRFEPHIFHSAAKHLNHLPTDATLSNEGSEIFTIRDITKTVCKLMEIEAKMKRKKNPALTHSLYLSQPIHSKTIMISKHTLNIYIGEGHTVNAKPT